MPQPGVQKPFAAQASSQASSSSCRPARAAATLARLDALLDTEDGAAQHRRSRERLLLDRFEAARTIAL